jgi:hypothetical protein
MTYSDLISHSPRQMRIPRITCVVLFVLVGSLSAGCHRATPRVASAPSASPQWEHCWWAALRTALPPDSVASRFARAYDSLGLANAEWSHQADTAWAEAGPTPVTREGGSGIVRARVVAYRRGDTTLVRPFSAVQSARPANLGAFFIGLCGEVIRAAKAQTTQPSTEEPDDSLPLWRRRPTH